MHGPQIHDALPDQLLPISHAFHLSFTGFGNESHFDAFAAGGVGHLLRGICAGSCEKNGEGDQPNEREKDGEAFHRCDATPV